MFSTLDKMLDLNICVHSLLLSSDPAVFHSLSLSALIIMF